MNYTEITMHDKKQAFQKAVELLGADCSLDNNATRSSGFPAYASVNNRHEHIFDFGNRFLIELDNGDIDIWYDAINRPNTLRDDVIMNFALIGIYHCIIDEEAREAVDGISNTEGLRKCYDEALNRLRAISPHITEEAK